MSSASFTIDSADTSNIHYVNGGSATWDLVQTSGDGNVFESTLSEADAGGASAVFQFQGTQVVVIGTLLPLVAGQIPASSIYTLDDSAPVEYDLRSLPSNYDGTQLDGVTFFSSGILDFEVHQLVINVTTASNVTKYALDYIAYSVNDQPLVPGSSSSSNMSSTSPQPSQNTTPSSHSSTPVGAIVGGVVGGVVALASLLALLLYYTRQRRRKEEPGRFSSPEMDTVSPLNAVVPFTQAEPSSLPVRTDLSTLSVSLAPEDSASQAPWRDAVQRYRDKEQKVIGASEELDPAQPSSSGQASTSQPTSSQPPLHHVDSGIRFSGVTPPVVEEIPPEYTP